MQSTRETIGSLILVKVIKVDLTQSDVNIIIELMQHYFSTIDNECEKQVIDIEMVLRANVIDNDAYAKIRKYHENVRDAQKEPKRDLLKKALKIIGNEQGELERLKYVLDNELSKTGIISVTVTPFGT